MFRGEHGGGVSTAFGYAETLLRPLRRRAETIARPARVFIRARKPCLRERRRLLGWKVRLPLATVLTPSNCSIKVATEAALAVVASQHFGPQLRSGGCGTVTAPLGHLTQSLRPMTVLSETKVDHRSATDHYNFSVTRRRC